MCCGTARQSPAPSLTDNVNRQPLSYISNAYLNSLAEYSVSHTLHSLQLWFPDARKLPPHARIVY